LEKKVIETLGHAYTDMHIHTHAPNSRTRTHTRVPKTMKDKFFTLKLRFGTNPTSFGSRSKLQFSHYIKPYMVPIQNIQKILRKNLRFTRNSESNRKFFKIHS